MSRTIIANFVQLLSSVLVLYGFTSISSEQLEAIVVTIGLIGQVITWVFMHFNRVSQGDVNLVGVRKGIQE